MTKTKEKSKKVPFKHTMPAVFRVLFSVVFLATLSIIYTWYLLWRQNLCNGEMTENFIHEKPTLFAYSCIVICLLMLVAASITWRPFLTAGLTFSVIAALSYAHIQKFTIRQDPLLPEDLLMAGQLGGLMEFVDIWQVVRLVIGIIFILVGSGLLDHFTKKVIGKQTSNTKWWERFSIIPRCTFTIISAATLILFVSPIVFGKGKDSEKTKWIDGLEIVSWHQSSNYQNNGFVIGFLYNLGALQANIPDGYSESRMAEIHEIYNDIKEADADRKPLDSIVDNIIFVLNESFYDPEILGEYYAHYGGDVVPNLHKIFEKYPSGYMYSTEYGGSTANVEFAAMTGLSNYWARTVPYVNSVSRISYMPGLASFSVDNGFSARAVHAYDGTLYKRNLVYKNMKFEEFRDAEKMIHTAKENGIENGYISDGEVYKEVLEMLDDGQDKHMIAAITMQNHSAYDTAGYPTYHFTLKNRKDSNWHSMEASFESLYHADMYLGDFIKELDKLDEKTVMIWFGDHAAGVLDHYINSSEKELFDKARLTPYFVYANFELDNTFTEKEVAEWNKKLGFQFPTAGVDLPTVTPNCITNIMYNILGVEKPTLTYILDEVCEKTPILDYSYFREDVPEETGALEAYKLINYDILNGKRYWIDLSAKE